MGQKKSLNFLGQQKKSRDLSGQKKKSRNLAGQKKITQPLNTKKMTQPLWTKNVLKIQILVTNKVQEIGTDHLGLVFLFFILSFTFLKA